ncbi:SDR family oxidoreductase [Nocardia terpenica]|uniref:Short-chain dehydrogenase n=1 Tax=Nocardia terpenica TaxID=455432 RepID=A0A164PNF4_9NOCA|nr:SDR family oxidoreductase [Nocardia terpenica]KZM75816.1 short-chain dehydrogenase [Nocardia terpenica]MBF6064909.1 SDR family oxidoreductase [Nocardia terpenica]MBF6107424.1 SDR family oxidoreductase [Nocardia terpenica]MBF6115181.1 SDR family oxidoreductase [Nocardia terpenica]MBF6122287.1 SDR family oxidoreductase [Nocardia terpenica]
MEPSPTALITGASAGFGRAVALALAARGWDLILTARTLEPLARVREATGAMAIAGDVADPAHRARLATVLDEFDRLDLVVNNASALGPSPMPRLADYPLDEFATVLHTNVVAPLGVLQLARPKLQAAKGIAVSVSSDAATTPYEGWGGYGSSKSALDQLTAIFAAENPQLRVYSFDPGDMRTAMHQAAFPGEDISDRSEPGTVVPALLHLIDNRPPSGRYIAAEILIPQ